MPRPHRVSVAFPPSTYTLALLLPVHVQPSAVRVLPLSCRQAHTRAGEAQLSTQRAARACAHVGVRPRAAALTPSARGTHLHLAAVALLAPGARAAGQVRRRAQRHAHVVGPVVADRGALGAHAAALPAHGEPDAVRGAVQGDVVEGGLGSIAHVRVGKLRSRRARTGSHVALLLWARWMRLAAACCGCCAPCGCCWRCSGSRRATSLRHRPSTCSGRGRGSSGGRIISFWCPVRAWVRWLVPSPRHTS